MSDLELLYRGATYDSDLAGLNERAKADPTLARMLAGLIEYVQDSTYENMDESVVPDSIRESIERDAVESYMLDYTCDCCSDEYDRGYTDGKDSRDNEIVSALVPECGSFVGFKRVLLGVNEFGYRDRAIAKVLIPEDAGRICGSDGDKCRASRVLTLEIVSDEGDNVPSAIGTYTRYGIDGEQVETYYHVGQVTEADSFNPDPGAQCTNGIHFFLTRAGAESYV